MKFTAFGRYLLFCLFLYAAFPSWAQGPAPDFSAIDLKARRSPASLNNNLPDLIVYLTSDADSELAKVRSIYVWITSHIGYDRKAADQNKRINHTISDILDRRLALCFGYAQLFEEMCKLAGIKSTVVNGYGKGTESALLLLEEPNHSWNAVRIDGDWRLVDATWGSSSTQNNGSELEQLSNDDYFLTPPEKFVLTHLPGNPMWQLLRHPVPMEVFLKADTTIAQYLLQADSSYTYADSLEVYFSRSPERRRLLDYELTYATYPSKKNGGQLGHALIDYAGILSDSLEQFSAEQESQKAIRLNAEIIRLCRRAQEFITFYPWQLELFINALLNQAVYLYNWGDETQLSVAEQQEEIISILKEAGQLLSTAQDSYFSRIARQRCEQYLEIVGSK